MFGFLLETEGLEAPLVSSANVSNGGGTQNFAASFQQPPVILPSNPGLQFTPPPSFSSTTGSASGAAPGAVSCQVR